MSRPNPAEGLLVRGWQHKDEVHIRGCEASQYYAGACSDACLRACELVGDLTAEEIAELPIDKPCHRSSLETYG